MTLIADYYLPNARKYFESFSGVLDRSSKTVHEAPEKSAHEFLLETLQSKSDVTLIAIGPLTNLHAVEKQSPGVLSKAKRIIIMGGS